MARKLGFFSRIWLNHFTKPAEERVLLKHVLEHDVRDLLEIGLGTLERTERLLSTLGSPAVRYVGLDLFESRSVGDAPGVTLKEAHRRLTKRCAVQLVPGDVSGSLGRICNHIGVFDMVLVADGIDARSLERVWFFVRRLVRPTSAVFEQASDGRWQMLTREQLDARSHQVLGRQAA
jgi:hypothetical protein